MNASETYTDPYNQLKDYNSQYSKASYMLIKTTTCGENCGFKEDASPDGRWLRSPCRNSLYYAGTVFGNGYLSGTGVDNANGLSPCFCL